MSESRTLFRRCASHAIWSVGFLSSLLLVGCGDTTRNDTKEFIIINNEGDPPLLRILRVANGGPFDTLVEPGPSDTALQGIITIAFNVKDTDTGDEIDILGEYSTDGGLTFNFATGFLNPSPPAVFQGGALTYIHDPTASTDPEFPSVNCVDFVWDAVTDLGLGTQIPNLIFRLTPNDRTDDGISAEVTFAVDNLPSIFAPEADLVSTPATLPGLVVPGANITFTYRLKDTDAPTNLVGICPQFALGESGGFTIASEAASPPAVSQGIFGLAASASGSPHVFVWDSAADFLTAGILCSEDVVFQILPKDIGTILAPITGTMLTGTPGFSEPFIVANFPDSPSRGTADVPTPFGIQSGCIQISYSIRDADSSLSAAIVEFSTDGGVSFQVATENAVDGMSEGFCGTSGIVTSPVGLGHVFAWNTIADGISGTMVSVIVRVTPFDGLFGTSGQTMPFLINNPAISAMSAPGIMVTTPEVPMVPGSLSDAINIGHDLFDFDSDPVDIAVEFSTDGGTTFLPATERSTAAHSGTIGLISSPCGTTHTYVWDSLCDAVGLTGAQDVILRFNPSDVNGVGAPDSTLSFSVQNGTLPTIIAADVTPVGSSPFSTAIDIGYTLQSTVMTSCATITAEYTLDSMSFFAATPFLGPPSDGTAGLTADVAPVAHIFTWDSEADGIGAGMVATNVIFRIRPALAGLQGNPQNSQPFTIENP